MSAAATVGVIEGAKPRTYQAGAAGMTRGTAVMQGADDAHLVPATAGAQAVGILGESTINIGDAIAPTRFGEAYAICGAAVTAGQYLVADANGHLIPSAAAGDKVVGYAVSSAAVALDQFVVFVSPFIR